MWYNNKAVKQWPVGQAAKTLASHAGNMGSIPVRVTSKRLRNCPESFFMRFWILLCLRGYYPLFFYTVIVRVNSRGSPSCSQKNKSRVSE